MCPNDPHVVRDALVRDAAAEQRSNGVMPTSETEAFVVGILDRLDRQKAEAPPPKPLNPQKKPGAKEREFERRGGTPGTFGTWSVAKGPEEKVDPVQIRRKRLRMDKWANKIVQRLRLLRSKYDWLIRLEAINPLATNGSLGPAKRIEAECAYWRILLDSEAVFGPIFADNPKPLWFS